MALAARVGRCWLMDAHETVGTQSLREEKSMQQHQTVSQMAEEVLQPRDFAWLIGAEPP